MNLVPLLLRWSSLSRGRVTGCLLLLLGAGAGCQREEIQVYTARKETPRAAPAPAADLHSHLPKARPQVTWTLPKDWKESGAGQMSVANFAIQDAGGREAQVTVTPLARLAGRDTEIVNMWREQVGLEPLSREEAVKQFEAIEVGGEKGNLFQIEGKPQGGSGPARIVTAMVHRPDASWFYKLAGDAALVEAQKPAFIEFLKSIRIKEAASPPETPAETTSKANWTVPGQWKELPAGQMQLAKFAVTQRGSAKAEVSVSIFPNDTGGTLANVNRWRQQIGLPVLKDGELSSVASPLDPSAPGAILVDMKSDSKQLLGAIVPRDGRYWFYKLMGDAEAVAPEKESFVAFVKSKP
jgi:hypothetical protein